MPERAPGSIVFAGSLAQKPRQGGHSWVFLQYLLGFRRLGWNVLFLDRLEPGMCVDDAGRPCPLDRSVNLRYMQDVMTRFDLADSYALLYDRGQHVIGLPRRHVVERTRNAAFLLNVMGFLDDEEILGQARKRVFLDIDPGFGQMWRDLGLADLFQGHDAFVTIGENIGQTDCAIPTCGLSWITTRQPVVLDCWPPQSGMGDGWFTSIGSWRGPYAPIEYQGKTYGLRVHEFRKFVTIPRLSRQPFQVALDIHPADASDRSLLDHNDWSIVAPATIAADPDAYQRYIQRSKAEFMVAKNMYVQTNSGWFSDRSICYLASGRPVLAEDTGLARLYPTGEGLLTFVTPDEALVGVDALTHDYEHHARAARSIAASYFDSDTVLGRLIDEIDAV
jgi:hypothetical protein